MLACIQGLDGEGGVKVVRQWIVDGIDLRIG
jgi:hypothetical protein